MGRSPEGKLVAEAEDASYATGSWVVMKFPPGTVADNLEFWDFGPAEFYEIRVIVASEAEEGKTWGRVKASFR